MNLLLKSLIKKTLRKYGYDVIRYAKEPRIIPSLPDLPVDEANIISQVAPFTLTSSERLAALVSSVKYLSRYRIAGDIVECGVWRGGSMMAVALALLAQGDTTRQLFLYDTFTGMTTPTDRDVDIDGHTARSQVDLVGPQTQFAVGLREVKENLFSINYPRDRIHFIEGLVEETIPLNTPTRIALLRLDTDWYESTRHELTHLFPLVQRDGIVIIDDYGHWQGAKEAVDEYFAARSERVFLHRIDYSGRMIVRCGKPD